ncbi:hypothetical protein EN836_09715 [Mesorhizobium sp. M1C.F.Ca.ET.193.01.1.1]|uniref:DUF6638 family protein n=1 Tax=unclassified Mesorhizobium TaxID=325217 RepID=UPI000FD56CB2|nr:MULTISPECIES: DUF6638 family protein [unclassified Mesorhizobium]TGT02060.1 hypothetical protein EN820_26015 [bacterium M00.F.Ca.ET.177.01.1.1]TGQ54313.1 hypothetical protein EN853_09710 [Mesorhizobium sp. M1C.F.Ca.ET.210.01.1.1]TGQ72308.1 hypothetical protein EN855_009720 [Mesorhizobium sp. M1C.F.Ca.ET.212.01.1.1]TGR10105.1 hypothetical protein EN847_09715 [Mesorhizobium sp. M1C.F.Ca.ET.204.01.1.1]TGR30708.1 hypothetical protein EN839_09715 [Mesorhizobium sp. M1C.F.Ca.ET.196.01.1.1]
MVKKPDLLRDNELIYGRLLAIDEPHLIQRYNKALVAFGLEPTKLKSFQIDRTGFSPEVAEECGDYNYLDPNEVNRRFIILTPSQIDLPVVHTAFSNTSQLMFEFMSRNQRAIDALTIKDVIYGEIEDSIPKVNDIEDLLSINQVEFKVLSAEDVLGKAAELGKLVDRLKLEPDAWRDNAMLERMVELAKVCGDIRENALVPDQVIFRHNAYWTSHFGGLYVFVDPDVTTVISDPAAPGFRRSRPWQVSYLSINDADKVFRFLAATGRLDLPRASWIEASGYLEHRAEMVVRALIRDAEPNRNLTDVDKVWLQTWILGHADLIASDGNFPFLNAAKREIAQFGHLKLEDVPPRQRFLVVRAKPDHPDAWLTNQLISDFVPQDFVSRYVFNKPGFYKDFDGFSDAWRSHVVDVLKTTYLKDKAAFRARLYGLTD